MRYILLAVTIVFGATQAEAQSSQCHWVGRIWTCNQFGSAPPPISAPTGIRWDMLNQPNAGDAAAQGFQQGQRIAIERRRAQLEQEQMAAQRDLFRAQAAAAQSAYPQSVAPTGAGPDYGKIWLAAARPRMHLFADFDAKVFSPETAISPDMVMFMSSSPYAADLAYHFATHRAEAMAVYKLSPLEAARVIDRIERDIKAAANEVAKP